MECSPLGSSVHGNYQARILEWVAIPFSRGSSLPRDGTQVAHIAGGFFVIWATREAQENWSGWPILSLGDLPDPGIELGSPALQVDSLPAELPGKPVQVLSDEGMNLKSYPQQPPGSVLHAWTTVTLFWFLNNFKYVIKEKRAALRISQVHCLQLAEPYPGHANTCRFTSHVNVKEWRNLRLQAKQSQRICILNYLAVDLKYFWASAIFFCYSLFYLKFTQEIVCQDSMAPTIYFLYWFILGENNKPVFKS